MARHCTVVEASEEFLQTLHKALQDNKKGWDPRLRKVQLHGHSLHVHTLDKNGIRWETAFTLPSGKPKPRPH